MKKFIKIVSIIAVLSTLIISPILAKAAGNGINVNYTINASTASVTPGTTFTVAINVTGATQKIASNTIVLNYDASKFQYVSYKAPNPVGAADVGINATSGKIIYLYSDNMGGMNAMSSGNVVTFTFKALNSTGTGSFSFSVSGVADQNAQSYNVAGASGTTNVTVAAAPVISSNNNLGSLSVEGGTLSPAFNKYVTTYNITVDADATTIYAAAEDGTAYVQGTGYTTLKMGLNTFYVTVTAANGAQKTYVLNITRPIKGSTNVALSSLKVSDTNISYNGGAYYSATVSNNVKKITINATASDSKTTLSGVGDHYLSVGENTFVITATSESGITGTYTIVITRNSKDMKPTEEPKEEPKPENPTPPVVENKSNNNYLKNLSLTGASFKFIKERLNYSATVPYTQDSLEILYEAEDKTATVKIIAEDGLRVGSNNIFIEVTAENGDTRTYQIVVTRNDAVPTTEYTSAAMLAAITANEEVVIAIFSSADTMLLDDIVATKLKETKKTITIKILDEYDNIQGVIIVDGKYINNNSAISLDLNRKITDKKLIDALDMNYVGINTKGANIPEGTLYRHYIDSIKDKYVLYYIENGQVVSKDLNVINGYVEFELEDNSNYAIVTMSPTLDTPSPEEPEPVISPVVIPDKDSGSGKWYIFGGGVLVLAGGAVGAAYVLKKKKSIIEGAEVEYLDLEPEDTSSAAPAVENAEVDTIPAMDTLGIAAETLSSESEVEILAIPNPEGEPKDETTGAKENYHFSWQKEYFSKKEKEDKIKADLVELLDPKYEIRPILSAEAIAETFIDANIDFDFEPVSSESVIKVEEQVTETLDVITPETLDN